MLMDSLIFGGKSVCWDGSSSSSKCDGNEKHGVAEKIVGMKMRKREEEMKELHDEIMKLKDALGRIWNITRIFLFSLDFL